MAVILYGALAIPIGLLLLLFGSRLFKTVLATGAFLTLSLASFILISNYWRESLNWSSHADLYLFLFCLAMGIIGIILSSSLWMASLVGVGAVSGILLAAYLLTWKPASGHDFVLRPLLLGLGTVSGAILAFVYEWAIVMSATSILGSILICSGLDAYLGTGFNNALYDVVVDKNYFEQSASTYSMLATCALLAFLGFTCQLLQSSSKNNNKP